jgi:hypothetical protein
MYTNLRVVYSAPVDMASYEERRDNARRREARGETSCGVQAGNIVFAAETYGRMLQDGVTGTTEPPVTAPSAAPAPKAR